jgi:hypothetical protein
MLLITTLRSIEQQIERTTIENHFIVSELPSSSLSKSLIESIITPVNIIVKDFAKITTSKDCEATKGFASTAPCSNPIIVVMTSRALSIMKKRKREIVAMSVLVIL